MEEKNEERDIIDKHRFIPESLFLNCTLLTYKQCVKFSLTDHPEYISIKYGGITFTCTCIVQYLKWVLGHSNKCDLWPFSPIFSSRLTGE